MADYKIMIRGGSWNYALRFLRSANRLWNTPDYYNNRSGFRLIRRNSVS